MLRLPLNQNKLLKDHPPQVVSFFFFFLDFMFCIKTKITFLCRVNNTERYKKTRFLSIPLTWQNIDAKERQNKKQFKTNTRHMIPQKWRVQDEILDHRNDAKLA